MMRHHYWSVTMVMAAVSHTVMLVTGMVVVMMAVAAAKIVFAIVMTMMLAIFLPAVFLMVVPLVAIHALSFAAVMMTPPLRVNITCHANDEKCNHQRKKSGCCFHFIWG